MTLPAPRLPSPGPRTMRVHLIDGTYELFRHFYALPSETTASGQEVGATAGVVGSILGMLEAGVTHIAVATDHVIESFRNGLWPQYKDGSGIDPNLFSQFGLLEEALEALGVRVWPMIEFEADDGLAAGAAMAARDSAVHQVIICTPDKDLAQCVEDQRVVQLDRRRRTLMDASAVRAKFGVDPPSIPDYLALVGDSADGFPGVPRWGTKSTAMVLSAYDHIEDIPPYARDWRVPVRGGDALAASLRTNLDAALLFRTLATLRRDAPVSANTNDLAWTGPTPQFSLFCTTLGRPDFAARAERVVGKQAIAPAIA